MRLLYHFNESERPSQSFDASRAFNGKESLTRDCSDRYVSENEEGSDASDASDDEEVQAPRKLRPHVDVCCPPTLLTCENCSPEEVAQDRRTQGGCR